MSFHSTFPDGMMAPSQRYIDYFNMHANLDRAFFHPGGKHATEKLLNHLASLRPEATVLEIGCGIGETARLLLDRFPCRYVGIDASPSMLDRTRTRLRPYAGRCKLFECDIVQSPLPFDSGSVDAIIAESVFEHVLNVQEILRECHRVLRENGILCINSRLWNNAISSSEQQEANAFAEKLLGVQAASEHPARLEEWVMMIEKLGFVVTKKEKLDPTNHHTREERRRFSRRLFTFFQVLVNPSYIRYWCNNQRVEKTYRHVWDAMESWMLVARKL